MIQSENISAVQAEFNKISIPRTWWPLAPSVATVVEEAAGEYKPLVQVFANGYRSLSEKYRIDLAAWKWLRPAQPLMQVAEVRDLRASVGLHYMSPVSKFTKSVIVRCREYARNNPELQLWIRRRISLLELVDRLPDEQDTFDAIAQSFQFRYSTIIHSLYQDQGTAIRLSRELTSDALRSAALAALDVLCIDTSQLDFDANLMVPVDPSVGPEVFGDRWKQSIDLWDDEKEKRLVVVAETSAKYYGFWVPLLRGDENASLPGAPTAYRYGKGSAVFRDDLPVFHNFPKKLKNKWDAYVEGEYKHDMFISIPLMFAKADGAKTVAVMNIDLNVNGENGLWRAYHTEWLELSKKRASRFLEFVLLGFLAEQTALGSHQALRKIASDVDRWNQLPGSPPQDNPPLLEKRQ